MIKDFNHFTEFYLPPTLNQPNTQLLEDKIFDIVIMVGPFDLDIISQQIQYTKQNVIGYRNIYIISSDDQLTIDGCITISENIFPFSLKTVSNYHGKLTRNGWYLQQLLKLYSGFIIPNILDKYLVIDADTFFIKPTTFFENGKPLYNFGIQYHKPYFEHMVKLHPALVKVDESKSGICHHMVFETKYVRELFDLVESRHNTPFYQVFLENVVDYGGSGASEYEIYFNWMLLTHPSEIILRHLKYISTHSLDLLHQESVLDYISCHFHMRNAHTTPVVQSRQFNPMSYPQ
jgi:hypothetical protein